jgi:hypothetical protein
MKGKGGEKTKKNSICGVYNGSNSSNNNWKIN